MTPDSRLPKVLQDVRSSVAAADDARCGLVDYLEEGPYLPGGVAVALDALRDALNRYAVGLEAVGKGMDRIIQQQEKP